VHLGFGDGSRATTGYLLTATGPQGRSFVDHGFAPGRHRHGDCDSCGSPPSCPVATGHLLAGTWTVGNATRAGLSTVVTEAQARTAHVAVVDGTGTVARR